MDWDEARPQAEVVTVGEPLERLSLGDLEARIGLLEREIDRVKAELERKKAHGNQADAVFKI